MPSQDDTQPPLPDPRVEPSVAGLVQLVKDYARQETVGPIRGAGRWLALGTAGAVLYGVGTIMLMLGVLRVLQTDTNGTFDGPWMSLIPYAVTVVLAIAVIAVAVARITKKSLQKEQ